MGVEVTPHEAIRKRVHPALHHAITDDAILSDLDLSQLDLLSIACDLEEAHSFMFEGEPERKWLTVIDIVRAANAMIGADA